MRLSLGGLVKLVGLLAATACGLAVATARLEPEPMRVRLAGAPAHELINGFVMSAAPEDSRFLDVESGRVSPIVLPTADLFDYGSCSPWCDEEGEYQLVGRWARRGAGGSPTAFGMARYSMPSGRVLDEIPLEIPPASSPCWFPDSTARVLYTGGNGELYRIDFEGPGKAEGAEPVRRAVTWRVPRPGDVLMIRDPVWVNAPALDGRLIASLSYRDPDDPKSLTPSRLWWLKLDPTASAVVDAGPLSPTDDSGSGGSDRFPNVAVRPDGGLQIAWLSQRLPAWNWELRLAPLRFDPATTTPLVDLDEVRTLAGDQVPSLPPFTADGAYVYAVFGRNEPGEPRRRVVRLSTAAGAPAAGPVAAAPEASRPG